MRKLWMVTLSSVLAACGGDDGQQTPADARVMTVEHDLTCLSFAPPSVPMTMQLDSHVLDLTDPPAQPAIARATLTASSLDGATQIDSQLSDMEGNLTLTLTTNGQPTRLRYTLEATDYPRTLWFVSIGPSRDVIDPQRAYFIMERQARIDAIATALGTTVDPSKGSLEVLMQDCSGNDFYGATPTVADEPGLKWAMNGGANAWLVRAATLHHPNNRGESIAGAVNLTPGMKNFMLSDGTTTIGPVSFAIEAGGHTLLIVVPGYPRS